MADSTIAELSDHVVEDCPFEDLHPWGCGFEQYARQQRGKRVVKKVASTVSRERWYNTPVVNFGLANDQNPNAVMWAPFNPRILLQFNVGGTPVLFNSASLKKGMSAGQVVDVLTAFVRLIHRGPPQPGNELG